MTDTFEAYLADLTDLNWRWNHRKMTKAEARVEGAALAVRNSALTREWKAAKAGKKETPR